MIVSAPLSRMVHLAKPCGRFQGANQLWRRLVIDMVAEEPDEFFFMRCQNAFVVKLGEERIRLP